MNQRVIFQCLWLKRGSRACFKSQSASYAAFEISCVITMASFMEIPSRRGRINPLDIYTRLIRQCFGESCAPCQLKGSTPLPSPRHLLTILNEVIIIIKISHIRCAAELITKTVLCFLVQSSAQSTTRMYMDLSHPNGASMAESHDPCYQQDERIILSNLRGSIPESWHSQCSMWSDRTT
jgi:hypothetical protein